MQLISRMMLSFYQIPESELIEKPFFKISGNSIPNGFWPADSAEGINLIFDYQI